jgi:hypothetical protein
MVFISDSRLCGGHRWDECPKLTTLPDNNCILGFAGDTDYAYPMMMQIRQAMSGYRRIETRAMDVGDINGHVLKHANHLFQSVYDIADPTYVPDIEFLFGGYSWHQKKFRIWRYHYSEQHKKLIKEEAEKTILPTISGHIIAIGDQRSAFKYELRQLLKERYGENVNSWVGLSLDMEPFEALCRMLKKVTKVDTIGGAPQMVKSYQYMSCCPVGVYWPEKTDVFSNRTLLGRKMFDYEDTAYWFIDPETLYTNACVKPTVESSEESEETLL